MCPTCQGTNRATTNMVCLTCGRNYGPPEALHEVYHVSYAGQEWPECSCGLVIETEEQYNNHMATTFNHGV